MKVEFELEEVWTMFNAVVDEILAIPQLKSERKDLAALRRWRTDEMSPGTDAMKRVMLPGQQATPNHGLRACWPMDSSGFG